MHFIRSINLIVQMNLMILSLTFTIHVLQNVYVSQNLIQAQIFDHELQIQALFFLQTHLQSSSQPFHHPLISILVSWSVQPTSSSSTTTTKNHHLKLSLVFNSSRLLSPQVQIYHHNPIRDLSTSHHLSNLNASGRRPLDHVCRLKKNLNLSND